MSCNQRLVKTVETKVENNIIRDLLMSNPNIYFSFLSSTKSKYHFVDGNVVFVKGGIEYESCNQPPFQLPYHIEIWFEDANVTELEKELRQAGDAYCNLEEQLERAEEDCANAQRDLKQADEDFKYKCKELDNLEVVYQHLRDSYCSEMIAHSRTLQENLKLKDDLIAVKEENSRNLANLNRVLTEFKGAWNALINALQTDNMLFGENSKNYNPDKREGVSDTHRVVKIFLGHFADRIKNALDSE